MAGASTTAAYDPQHLYFKIKVLYILSFVSYFFILSCFVLLINFSIVSKDDLSVSCQTACSTQRAANEHLNAPSQSLTVDNSEQLLVREKRRTKRHKRKRYQEEKSSVEFFTRPRKTDANGDPAQADDGYRWLTSYSRIPVSVLVFLKFYLNT